MYSKMKMEILVHILIIYDERDSFLRIRYVIVLVIKVYTLHTHYYGMEIVKIVKLCTLLNFD
mgnify:CR=1 FL=1